MVKWQFIENEILAKLSTLTETKCVLGALGFLGGGLCVCACRCLSVILKSTLNILVPVGLIRISFFPFIFPCVCP